MRNVIHCDMNNYFASVELLSHPELCGRPVAVCGDPAMRHGIVLAKNEAAKSFGVATGEARRDALAKCPMLVCLAPNYNKYLHYAKAARQIYERYTDKIYPYGMDEAWLELSADVDGKAVADELRSIIYNELGLTASVGVSFNFIFAKLASDMKKPDATTVLSYSELHEVIWRLPAYQMLFVGNVARKTLRKMGILTIGDIAVQDPRFMKGLLGKKGELLWQFANGDDSGFNPLGASEEDIKSVGNTITPPKDIKTQDDAAAFLYVLSMAVSKRLKKHNLQAGCVSINIRRDDFIRYTRQRVLVNATDSPELIYKAAVSLLLEGHDWQNAIRTIGVRADKLCDAVFEQLSFDSECDGVDFDKAEAYIKSKYGSFNIEISSMSRDK